LFVAVIAFAGALVCGTVHLILGHKRPAPVLTIKLDQATGFVLGKAMLADVHDGDEVVVVHWDTLAGREEFAGVANAFSGTAVHVVGEVPSAVVPQESPTGGPPRVASEFRGAPPEILNAIGQEHPQAKAFFLFVNFQPLLSAGAAAAVSAPLALDAVASATTDLQPLLASGKVHAAAVRKQREDWHAKDAMRATADEVFAMRFDLVKPPS
jgi:hypothetical protein